MLLDSTILLNTYTLKSWNLEVLSAERSSILRQETGRRENNNPGTSLFYWKFFLLKICSKLKLYLFAWYNTLLTVLPPWKCWLVSRRNLDLSSCCPNTMYQSFSHLNFCRSCKILISVGGWSLEHFFWIWGWHICVFRILNVLRILWAEFFYLSGQFFINVTIRSFRFW